MLCATCGSKVKLHESVFVCNVCEDEYDVFDIGENLIPEPIFVNVRLNSQYAIIDTRKQEVYVRVDTIQKAKLIAELLNQRFSQRMIKSN